MTWDDLCALISAEMKRFEGCPWLGDLAIPERLYAAYLELDDEWSEEVDFAVEWYCESNEWPDLEPYAQTDLLLRLGGAWDLCAALDALARDGVVGQPPAHWTKNQAWQYLLVKCWHSGATDKIGDILKQCFDGEFRETRLDRNVNN